MFRKLVIIAFVFGLASAAWAVTIGNPTAGNGYDCSTYITATASGQANPGCGPEDTINGEGLNGTGLLHSIRWERMWFVETADANGSAAKYDPDVATSGPAWIAYEFDAVYNLVSMDVWNYNEYSGDPYYSNADKSIKNCIIEYSADRDSWTVLASPTILVQAPGQGYDGADGNSLNASEQNVDCTVSFSGVQAKYVVITVQQGVNGNFSLSGSEPNAHYGLSEVRFTADVNFATAPDPYHSESNVLTSRSLNWIKGDGTDIVKHRVYISTDQYAVENREAPNTVVVSPTHSPTLEASKSYFWVVDELDAGEAVVTGGEGNVWNFTVPDCVPGTEPVEADGNLNGDCFIDFKDFAIIADNWEIDGFWP
ncbi:MAG: hypothetical protein ACYSSI_02185 [Planctomycetota bacterium]|jgi:hypothetical protein